MPGTHAITLLVCAGAAMATVVLPDCLHGTLTVGPWALLAAIGSGLATKSCSRQEILRCLVGVMIGLTFDFLLVPPIMLLSLCGSGAGFGMPSLLAHLLWFPLTSLAMLVVLLHETGLPSWRTLPKTSVTFAAMLILMSLTMAGLRILAEMLDWPWTAQGMACAMTLSMIGFMAALGRIKKFRLGNIIQQSKPPTV